MTYTHQIETLIAQAKDENNSLERNKLVSHLEDARMWAKELDGKYKEVPNEPSQAADLCTCPTGGRRQDCPWHGATI